MTLGRNSEVINIIKVERTVCNNSVANSKNINPEFRIQSMSISPIKNPYTTKAILLPISMVAINFEGFSVSFAKILELKLSCIFSILRKTLLEETKAISIPEKNAESIKQI